MRYFTDSPFERLMMEVPHGHSLAAEAAWRHEQQATGKPAAFSLPSERRSSLNSTLIIAEKPSVALAIAAVVGADKRKNGYLEGNGYLVSWCVGHLVSLAQPENYDLRLARWQRADLPILPDPWQYVPNEKTKKQLDLLCSLMNRPDIETIVCATDAGREGELIFRLVYDCCRCSKPVKRLWISSLEESAIREGMAHLKDAAEYDLLYEAALCRAKADWLMGINLTRLYTLLYGPTLSIGRVMTPTLAMIVEREKAVASFTPKPFYTVHLLCPCEAASERFEDEQEAQALADACNGQTAEIIRVGSSAEALRPDHAPARSQSAFRLHRPADARLRAVALRKEAGNLSAHGQPLFDARYGFRAAQSGADRRRTASLRAGAFPAGSCRAGHRRCRGFRPSRHHPDAVRHCRVLGYPNE